MIEVQKDSHKKEKIHSHKLFQKNVCVIEARWGS